MIGNSNVETRLCPYCANSIAEDAENCRYCKAEFSSQSAPRWLKRDEAAPEPKIASHNRKIPSIPAKFIWLGGMLAVALIAFFAGGYKHRTQQSLASQTSLKQLQAKEQIIQTQEAQLAQTRQQLNENSTQLADMKTRLEQSQKELSLTQQRLSVAARQADRPNVNRAPVVRRTSSRAPDAATAPSQPVTARRTAPGVYETTRATSVHEDPSSTSRVISQIDRGTRINVVSSAGDWLEVRSKRGNPPGYVRSDDARQIGGAS